MPKREAPSSVAAHRSHQGGEALAVATAATLATEGSASLPASPGTCHLHTLPSGWKFAHGRHKPDV